MRLDGCMVGMVWDFLEFEKRNRDQFQVAEGRGKWRDLPVAKQGQGVKFCGRDGVFQRCNSMWSLSLPWWEFMVRGAVVYVFVILLLRVTGKRQTGQLEPFDLVLLLVLSNAVQNSMNGGDNSITGGLILAATLVGLNWLTGWITFKSRK